MRVGQAIREMKRYHSDKEFKKRKDNRNREWNKKNPEKRYQYFINHIKKMNEFKNNRCEICNKLLNHRTTSNRCHTHRKGWKCKK